LTKYGFDTGPGIPLYVAAMHQTFADRHCGALPGAERVQPFGPDTVVWRIHGHMFAAYTDAGDGLSLRTANMARALRATTGRNAGRPPAVIGPGWVLVPWSTPIDTLRARIDESYALVRRDWPNAIPRPVDANGEEAP